MSDDEVPPAAGNNEERGRQHVRMPPFDPERPDMWFVQLEASFSLANVAEDMRRYYSVISLIQARHLVQFQGIIRAPPEDGTAYDALKRAVIERFADTEATRLRKLLNDMELGDRRPSHLLEEMRELSSGKMDDSMLIQIWKQRLPQPIQQILSGSAESTSSTELARIADRIRDVEAQKTVNAVQTPPIPNVSEALIAAVAALTRKIDEMQTARSRPRGNSVHGNWQRQRSSSNNNNAQRAATPARNDRRDDSQPRMCWYHRSYGSDARNCTAPCSFQQSSRDNPPS